jgi:hypothetical protein
MDFASSPISVEKNRVGPGVAGVLKRLDRLVIKHEIEALILTGIRGREEKRRTTPTLLCLSEVFILKCLESTPTDAVGVLILKGLKCTRIVQLLFLLAALRGRWLCD